MKHFPIVAIGASAGGLEAVTKLLQNIPSNIGMAFIYVQHLSPDYQSMLALLLSKSTLMKVKEVKNKMFIKPNNFYVIPPDKEMTTVDGYIKLKPRKEKSGHIIIDTFFLSMAKEHKKNAIGILLSGSGSDGARGMQAIKQQGGWTFAQDNSAKFTSMPQSAITKGVVDFILPPQEIAAKLAELSKNKFARRTAPQTNKKEVIENTNPDFRVILQLLYKRTNVDFSHYKMNTIKRRIMRRMPLCKVKTLKQYAALLRQESKEVDILYKDLLINVTNFFRDNETFVFLKSSLLSRLLKSKEKGETLRIWIPACSTGEEAYSIAMILLEIQGSKPTVPIQIFATDLSASAIERARKGEYSERQMASVSPQRLQRFFTKSKFSYHIVKPLRDMCVFAQHNILRDPPFSHIDFISCCNLLIYLDAAAQKKAIATFHYALNANGFLMLGKSETPGTASQHFILLNKKFRIYSRKKNHSLRTIPDIFPRFSNLTEEVDTTLPEKTYETSPLQNTRVNSNAPLDNAIDSFLLSRHMPASMVINHEMEIIQFRGTTSLYLRHSSGKASFNILKMARPEFAFELRNAIHKAIKTKQAVHKTGIEIKINSALRIVRLEVTPLKIEGEEPLLVVTFTEQQQIEMYPPDIYREAANKNNSHAKDRRIKKLEEELASARAAMYSITHDQEAVNEELQSANEEVVSNNEELRTLNEELETSKEEIESTNEELISTNAELQMRNEQLTELNSYSELIIATMHNPMLILNKDLSIKTANKPFYDTFQVTERQTIGSLFFELANHQWDIPKLRKLIEEVLPKNTNIYNFELSHSFSTIGEKIMVINARRVFQKTSNEDLIMLVMEDITEEAHLRLKEKTLIHELQDANKLLNAKNTELTSFNYISSHDLQEPLRKIQSFAIRVLEKEYRNLSEEGKDYFQRMQNAAIRMQALIDDLLAYSRTTTAEKKFKKTNLNIILEDVKSDLKEIIQEKNAIIDAGKLGEVKIIAFQFRQLLTNLISNSLKFSKPGVPPHIIIKSEVIQGRDAILLREKSLGPTDKTDADGQSFPRTKALSPDTAYCHITISDNGIGFDSQYKDRIFEVFQRLYSYDEYKGTGIGLAICKKIVENHNGIITATGKVNKGAKFDIYIPVN